MWSTEELGLAVWRDEGSAWYLDARGGDFGIGIVASTGSNSSGFDTPQRFVSLAPVEQDFLPSAGEQYVRGDRWNINYPQGESSYALRLSIQPIESLPDLIVLEFTVSIQTDLLDTHPKIDVEALCRNIDSCAASDGNIEDKGSAPISLAVSENHSTGVLLGPHDSPFTTDHSTDSLLRLRLFGEFLEKGVIRKARPWIVIQRGGSPPDQDQLESWWKQLCGSPLPLTP